MFKGPRFGKFEQLLDNKFGVNFERTVGKTYLIMFPVLSSVSSFLSCLLVLKIAGEIRLETRSEKLLPACSFLKSHVPGARRQVGPGKVRSACVSV